jgi:hypothetical protein
MRFEGNDGPRSLPPQAVALIEHHRSRPLPAEPVAGAGEPATHPSLPPGGQRDGSGHPSLSPGPDPALAEDTVGSRAGGRHPSFPPASELPGPAPAATGAGEDRETGAHRADPGRRADRRLAIVLACLAAVVLAGGGLEIGTRLGDSGGGAAQQQADPGRPPDGPAGAGQPPPLPPGQGHGDHPEVSVNQPFGDSRTTFVVSGRGWRPETAVAVTLDGRPLVPAGLTTDREGAFNYTLNQGGQMFPTGFPAGRHTVIATAAGKRDEATFEVGR